MATNNAANISSSGVVSYNGNGTFSGRTFTGGAGVSVTNGDGISGDPVVSATGSSSSSSAPATLDFVEDFLIPMDDSLSTTCGSWRAIVSSTVPSVLQSGTTSGRPGVVKIDTETSSTGAAAICHGAQTSSVLGNLVLGGGELTVQWYAKLSNLSDGTETYTARIGLGDTYNATQANGLWFEYTHSVNSGNWVIKSSAASSPTSANTNTAADTNWHVYKIIVNSGATSASFYIDGVQVANSPITSTIPTLKIGGLASIVKSAGTTSRSILLDLFTLNYVLTTSR